MNIWIFQTGEPLHIDKKNYRPMRAMNLANMLVDQGHSVTIWSSAFFHQEKKHRTREYKKIKYNELLEIRLIPSSGYNKNISVQRLYDHAILSMNLKKALNKEITLPDVAFIGYPPIEFAYVAQKWLKKRNIQTILDIKDLWPDILISFLPKYFKIIGKIFLFPYFFLAKKVINNATAISSMTDRFLNHILNSFGRRRSEMDLAFPFSSLKVNMTESELISAKNLWWEYGINKNAKFRLCYIGNLSPNIDLEPVKQAAIYFEKKSQEIEIIICGDGVSFEEYKQEFSRFTSVKFTGRVNNLQAFALSQISQATLIPYKNSIDFQLSLPNKFVDSLSYGLPVLSPLSGEVAKMIEKYNVGVSYGKLFNRNLIDGINILINNNNLLNEMAENCRNIYQKNFTYQVVYKNLANHLTGISQKIL